jgi:putative polysaccharide biosynthesis protein
MTDRSASASGTNLFAADGAVQKFRRHAERFRPRQKGNALQRMNRLANDAALLMRGLHEHGASIKKEYGIGILKQARRMAADYFSLGFSPVEFYTYRFFLDGRRHERSRHFGFMSHIAPIQGFLAKNAADRPVLQSKSLFARRCDQVSLPTLPLLGEFRDGRFVAGPEAIPDGEDLFSKPSELWCGLGATSWRWMGSGLYRDVNIGAEYDLASMIEKLCADSRSHPGPLVLQRRFRNHPAIASIAPSALSTIRIATCRSPGGEIELFPPVIRMPTNGSIVDNFAQGGLAAPVDLASGKICGPAIQKNKSLGIVSHEHHPNTQARLRGFQIPFWPEAVTLAKLAHSAFPTLHFVGWDIAILPKLPVVLEGNVFWDVDLTVLPHGISLADTQFVSYGNHYLDSLRAEI